MYGKQEKVKFEKTYFRFFLQWDLDTVFNGYFPSKQRGSNLTFVGATPSKHEKIGEGKIGLEFFFTSKKISVETLLLIATVFFKYFVKSDGIYCLFLQLLPLPLFFEI
jgi:hypothetical protein